MNNNHRITLNTNKNIIVEFTNERIIPASGLAVVGALLGKSDFIKKLNRMDVTSNRSQHQIKNGDIVLTYLGMLCMGKPYFEAVHEMDDDKDFYKTALGITRSIPSEDYSGLISCTLFCPVTAFVPGADTEKATEVCSHHETNLPLEDWFS